MRAHLRVGCSHIRFVGAAMIAVTIVLGTLCRAAGPHDSFLAGPWEIVVQLGHEGQVLHFPIRVADQNKPEELDQALPVMGTPIVVKLNHYVPHLDWKTTCIEHPGGGCVAKLTVTGGGVEREHWLSSADPSKRSISSRIGGVALKELLNADSAVRLLREIANGKAIGILSVWLSDAEPPQEYAVSPGAVIALPGSRYKLSVLEYVPHYSVDTRTKKVLSQSSRPVNPAIRVRLEDGQTMHEQWLWAKFASPHQKTPPPLRMKFTDVHVSQGQGRYILVAARGSKPQLLYRRAGKMRVEIAALGKAYAFTDESYTFTLDKLTYGAMIKTSWKNRSERLIRPAVVAAVQSGDTADEAVLELNKPTHHNTELGTLVLLYRRQAAPSDAGR